MIVEYHKQNYFGENIIIVGAGGHDHDKLVEIVEKTFNKFRSNPKKIQE